jgi:hypothetical protein
MDQSRNFGKFMKLILAWVPKHHFILVTCSTITKIQKNRCQEEIVSKMETQIKDIRSQTENSQKLLIAKLSLKFHIFFDIRNYSMNVTQLE